MSASKRWVFTLNNYHDDDESKFTEACFKYLVIGREVGEEGTPHLQGFITFGKTMRLAGVRKLHPRAHWEPAKGTSAQASDYCKKDGDFKEFGDIPKQGQRNDLKDAITVLKSEGLKASAEQYPQVFVKYSRGLRDLQLILGQPYEHSDVRGVWIHGPPGTGKSHWCRQQFKDSLYIKPQNKWFDGYGNEKCILLDDLDTDVLAHHLKIWADKYSCTGETKGGTVHLQHHVFAVTSNYSPCELFKDEVMLAAIERRFLIVFKDTIDTPINLT